MDLNRLEYLHQKYVNEDCSPSEHLELMTIINSGSDEEGLQKLMDSYWDELKQFKLLDSAKSNEIFNRVIEQRADQKVIPIQRSTNWITWAAAVLVVAIGSAVIFYNIRSKQVNSPILQAHTSEEHQQIKLPDGSVVVLNSNSILRYPATFNNAKREVTLVGEGYFDIKHDSAHPFIVHTGELITTVLGTAFDISAYEDKKTITVTVTRGKVSVSDDKKVLGILTPNQQLAFNKEKLNTVDAVINSNKVIAWQSRDLFLDDITMEDAANVLEQRFDVKIAFSNDAVKEKKFTGTFLHGEKLADILQVICEFNNATYKTAANGDIVIGSTTK